MDLDHALGRKGWGTDAGVSIVDDILVGLLGKEPPDALDWDAVDVAIPRRRASDCGRRAEDH